MGTKPDFTQKLLHDLRLRKERVAAAQPSANAYRKSSGDTSAQSRGPKTPHTVGIVNGSTQRSSTTGHKLPVQQSVNQVVPYERGYHPPQKGDLAMAIAYAFDDRGKLKTVELKSNNDAMVNLLQQIGRKSVRQTSNMQWQSTDQFPTLTHLHIDEIARGAQRLNQILNVCNSGDKGSIEVGKELWKGAMELEQSLRMLVSLQEASNCTIKPQKKSRLKLLEEGEDCDDNTIPMVIQKQVERPVFSFDKPSKRTKVPLQTDLQQKQQALTNLIEDPTPMPEKQGSKNTKSSHRRSISCGPELQSPQQISSSKLKQKRLPNVIAKLMGLEESPQNLDQNLAIEIRSSPKHRSGEMVLRTSHEYSRNPELKAEVIKNVEVPLMQNRLENVRTTATSNTNGQQEEKANKATGMADDSSYRTTPHQQNKRWKEEKRVETRNLVKDSQAAIHKINELQSQIIQLQLNGEPGTATNTDKEVRASSITQIQQKVNATETLPKTERTGKTSSEVSDKEAKANNITGIQQHATETLPKTEETGKTSSEVSDKEAKANSITGIQQHATETLPKTEETGKTSSEVSDKTQGASMGTCSNNEGEIAANKPADYQQKNKTDNSLLQLGVPRDYEPRGKKHRAGNRIQHTVNNKSQQSKRAASPQESNKFHNASSQLKKFAGTENEGPAIGRLSGTSNFKDKSSARVKSGRNAPLTNRAPKSKACNNFNTDVESASISRRELAGEATAQRANTNLNAKANEVMTVKTVTAMVGSQKTVKQIFRQKIKKPEKLIVSGAAAKPSAKTSKRTQAIVELCGTPREEETQKPESEHMCTANHPNRGKSYHPQNLAEPSSSNRGENTSSVPDNQKGQQLEADEVHMVEPQEISTASKKDGTTPNNPLQQQRPTIEKQEPLSEGQINLKQKLIQSHLLLNTAEALFKLNIPIGILNYASDQIYHNKDSKLPLDCCYELLKRKGRIKEMSLYPNISKVLKCTEVTSLDNLVRQLHEAFQTLQSYGRNGTEEYDQVEYILKMLERDIYHRAPILNSMWDLGWNETVFAYTDTDETITDVEHYLLDELLNEIVGDAF